MVLASTKQNPAIPIASYYSEDDDDSDESTEDEHRGMAVSEAVVNPRDHIKVLNRCIKTLETEVEELNSEYHTHLKVIPPNAMGTFRHIPQKRMT